MKKAQKPAGAPALAEGVSEAAPAALVAEPIEGGATESVESDTEVAETAPAAWPRAGVLRNHGILSLVEPITSKFLAAGGSEAVELRDQGHADAITDNFRELERINGIPVDTLTLDLT